MLLLAFPDLKSSPGLVVEELRAMGAAPDVMATWQEIVSTDIQPESDEDEFA